jgi:hypothetical protein
MTTLIIKINPIWVIVSSALFVIWDLFIGIYAH